MLAYFRLPVSGSSRLVLPETLRERKARARRLLNFWIKDFWFQHEMSVNLTRLADAMETDLTDLSDYSYDKNGSPRITDKILSLSEKLDKREVVLTAKHGAVYLAGGKPIVLPPLSEFWHLHGTCVQCGGNRYLPVEIRGCEQAACRTCCAPSQYPMMGAELLSHSLLFSELEKMGIIRDIERATPEPPLMKTLTIRTGTRGRPFTLKRLA